MCGHGLIGVVRTLEYLGRLEPGVRASTRRSARSARELARRTAPSRSRTCPHAATRSTSRWMSRARACDGRRRLRRQLVLHHAPRPACARTAQRSTSSRASRRRMQDALRAQGITGADGAEIDHIELHRRPRVRRRGRTQLRALPRRRVRSLAVRHRHVGEDRRAARARGSSPWPAVAAGEHHRRPVHRLARGARRRSSPARARPRVRDRRSTLRFDPDDPFRSGLDRLASRRLDAIVIGAGIVGASAARRAGRATGFVSPCSTRAFTAAAPPPRAWGTSSSWTTRRSTARADGRYSRAAAGRSCAGAAGCSGARALRHVLGRGRRRAARGGAREAAPLRRARRTHRTARRASSSRKPSPTCAPVSPARCSCPRRRAVSAGACAGAARARRAARAARYAHTEVRRIEPRAVVTDEGRIARGRRRERRRRRRVAAHAGAPDRAAQGAPGHHRPPPVATRATSSSSSGYLTSAHSMTAESVAFNVQPRQTGQVLIGSSRELVGWDAIDQPRDREADAGACARLHAEHRVGCRRSARGRASGRRRRTSSRSSVGGSR